MRILNFSVSNLSSSNLSSTFMRSDLLTGGNIQLSGNILSSLVSTNSISVSGASIGTLYVSTFSPSNIFTTNLTATNVNCSLISSGSIGVSGATIGTLYVSLFTPLNINTINITTSTLNVSGTISSGTFTGSIVTVGSIGASGITVGTLYSTSITGSNAQFSGTISGGTLRSNTIYTKADYASISINNITDTAETSVMFYSNSTSGAWYVGQNVGGVGTGNFAIYKTGVGNIITALSTGNVGISTNTPAYKLDVNGTVKATAYTGSNISVSGTVSSGTFVGALLSTGSIGIGGATIGTLYASSITTANVSVSGTVSSGTFVGVLLSTGSIGVSGATVGTLYATTVTASNLYVSGSVVSVNVTTLNLIDNVISSGSLIVSGNTSMASIIVSGRITAASIGAKGVTVGTVYANNGTNASFVLNNSSIIFRANGDINHGLQYNAAVDGPELWGWEGGALGYNGSTGANSLVWSSSGINVNGTVSSGNIGSNGATIGTIYATTITSASIKSTSVTSASIRSTNVIATNLTVSNLLLSPNAVFSTGISTGALCANTITVSNIQTSAISTGSINIPYGYNTINVPGYTNTALIDVSWDGANDVTSIYTPGNWSSGAKLCIKGDGSVTATSIGVTGATVGSLYATTISSSSIQISGTVSSANFIGSLLSVGNLYSTNFTTSNFNVSNLTVGNLTVTTTLNTGKLSCNTLGNIITTNGNIGINIVSPSSTARLHIYDPLITGTNFSTSSLLIDRFYTSGSYSGCHIMMRGGYYSANGTTDTNTTMDSSTSGNNRNDFIACLGGTTSATSGSWNSSNYTGIVFVVQGGGNSYNLNGVWGSISDARIKENIVDARNYLDDLNKLRVVKYSLKSDKLSYPNHLGLLAQEVEQVFPQLINQDLNNYVTDENGNSFNTKSIKHSVINMMMLKSIQELTSRIKTLEDKLSNLINFHQFNN